MNCCIKNVTIVNKAGKHHSKTVDILIRNGIITEISKNINPEKKDLLIDAKGMYVSQGWIDIQCTFGEPGYEHKETLMSGLNAAAAGGYTGVVLMPNTQPVLDNKSSISYVIEKSKGHITDVYPAGALTVETKGKDLSELYDMHAAGAIVFTDGNKSVQDSGTIMRALEYVKPFKGVIINKPNDRSISQNGVMNEGTVSAGLGLKPMPSLAEEVIVSRDIQLAQYCNNHLIIGPISTAKSVELIRQAKKKKIPVSCFVVSHNLYLDDTALESFDSNLKLNPPLRTKTDVKALHKAVIDNTIDAVASGHMPQNEEEKKVEFDYAAFGAINLQTSYAITNTAFNGLTPEIIARQFAEGPRELLNIQPVNIEVGSVANLTIFSLKQPYQFTTDLNQSKSSNSPYFNKNLTGCPIAVINNNQLKYCNP